MPTTNQIKLPVTKKNFIDMTAPAHLNALRAFEASARQQSFSAAAAELNVTPAAVGQLVRTLETWLGAPLFVRQHSGQQRLILTDAALRALPDIQAGFARLHQGVQKLRQGSAEGMLTVTVSPAFAAKWLLPRFERFQARYPDTCVRLETSLQAVDFAVQNVDVGVRYGTGHWPGLLASKLMDEEIYPVCAPAWLRRAPALNQPAALQQCTLIHDLSLAGHAGFPTWEAWFQQVGVADAPLSGGLQINNAAAVLQAAIEGQGVALARSVMAHEDVLAGRVVRLFPHLRVMSRLAYYVVRRPECASQPRVAAFCDWLHAEAHATPAIS